ncbi:MAG: isoprenylcysteine carboxylmethyltransferase family protein [Desulfobulbales bacterium]|nr:isoprenylcysteine carboxylmethyltransferase family protein [Desulfobulbales bacterium]
MPTLSLKIPPLVQAGLCLIAMGLLDRYLELLPLPIPSRPGIAAVLIILGGAVGAAGIVSFRREKTTIDPRSPEKAAALVVSGVYRYSRNPMYLAVLLILLGLAMLFGSLAAFLPIPLFVLSINRLQIEPEEEALEAVFGEGYRQYRKKVGRWL